LEDIINVLDGRPGLLEEVQNAQPPPRRLRGFPGYLARMIFPDESLGERTRVVTGRIRSLVQEGER